MDFTFANLKSRIISALGGVENYTSKIDSVLKLSFEGHEGQFREQGGGRNKISYVSHPVEVSLNAIELYKFEDLEDSLETVVCVCLAHDLIEDTNVTVNDLEQASTKRVSELVMFLSKPSVRNDQSRTQRNNAFLQQIISGGKTAAFIKICDAIHNLSYPKYMPDYLLLKTIEKANNHYYQLLDQFDFSGALRKRFEKTTRIAEVFHSSSSTVDETGKFLEFEKAIDYCSKNSASKILEHHDGLRILKEITGAVTSKISSIENYIDKSILPHLEEFDTKLKRIKIRKKLIQESSCNEGLVVPKNWRKNDMFKNISRIIFIPIDQYVLSHNSNVIILCLRLDNTRDWHTVSKLKILTTILFERLLSHQNKEVFDVSKEMDRLNINADPFVAVNVGFGAASIAALENRLNYAKVVEKLLIFALEHKLSDFPSKFGIEKVTSRVKSLKSIMNKMTLRRLEKFEDIDDLIGIRIICTSRNDMNAIIEYIVSELSKDGDFPPPSLKIDSSSIKNLIQKSSIGYEGNHIYFLVRLRVENMEIALPCEIQIRTIFSDAWATLAYNLSYKKKLKNKYRQHINAQLISIASLVDEIDEIIEKEILNPP